MHDCKRHDRQDGKMNENGYFPKAGKGGDALQPWGKWGKKSLDELVYG